MRYHSSNYYDRPNPHSFGDAGTMHRQQKAEKEEFKREEMQKELKQEGREEKNE